MYKTSIQISSTLFLILSMASCSLPFSTTSEESSSALDKALVQDSFNYSMVKSYSLTKRVVNGSGYAMSDIVVKIKTAPLEDSGELISTVITDADGYINVTFSRPAKETKIYIEYNYVGLPSGEWVNLSELTSQEVASAIEYLQKGAGLLAGLFIDTAHAQYSGTNFTGNLRGRITQMGTYDANGVPNYLEKTRDIITPDFLKNLNATLPETKPVPLFHPQYLEDGVNANASLLEDADVWVTFVSEGAGYTNALGYFEYDPNNLPTKVEDISNMKIIFPNVSFSGSGGGLTTGDKVKIGTFPAGTHLGFFLLANGWNSSLRQNINGQRAVFTFPELNPEANPSLKQHHVLVWDSTNKRAVLGFEDLDRMSGSDEDFNDAVFYISSNPIQAIDTSALEPIDTPKDSDGDGVSDIFDKYPDDRTRAFDQYFPSENTEGTLAFEDNWPEKGDFDFNDAVFRYRFHAITDVKSNVKELNIRMKLIATGAAKQNGIAIEFPVLPGVIESVQGAIVRDNYTKLNSNGTEVGADKAVVYICDNLYKVYSAFANVYKDKQVVSPYEFNVKVIFKTPPKLSDLGSAPFNTFMIVDKNRGHEIHLSNAKPTSLVDKSLFGTLNDSTKSDYSRTYKTSNNLPWVLNIPSAWKHLLEKEEINNGYLNFIRWAESSGSSDQDWYSPTPKGVNLDRVFDRDVK